MSEAVTFLAYLPDLQSAIQITGGGNGMRLKIDVPETEMASALSLLMWRGKVLRITVEPDDTGRGDAVSRHPAKKRVV